MLSRQDIPMLKVEDRPLSIQGHPLILEPVHVSLDCHLSLMSAAKSKPAPSSQPSAHSCRGGTETDAHPSIRGTDSLQGHPTLVSTSIRPVSQFPSFPKAFLAAMTGRCLSLLPCSMCSLSVSKPTLFFPLLPPTSAGLCSPCLTCCLKARVSPLHASPHLPGDAQALSSISS